MFAQIKKEFNDERMAQRLYNIPLYTEININGKKIVFKNKDWSATGIGIYKNSKDEKNLFEKNKIYEASIILTTKTSKILLDVKIKYRNSFNDAYGFSFEEISEANKRTIRNYIANIIEGKTNSVESISSDLSMPEIPTPINEVITLDSDHKLNLKKAFLKKTYINITLFIMFILFAFLTILYNNSILYVGKGITTDNYMIYKIPVKGKIIKLTSKKLITKDEVIFSYKKLLSESEILKLNEMKNNFYIDKQNKLLELSSELQKIYNKKQINTTIYNNKKEELLTSLKLLNEEFFNADKLYKEHLILKNSLNKIKNKINFIKNELKNIELNKKSYNTDIKILKQKINELLKTKFINPVNNSLINVKAVKNGKIHSIKVKENEILKENTTVLISETNDKSYVIINIPKDKMDNITIGLKTLVKYNNRYYKGKIVSLGYSSTSTLTNSTMEVSLKDTIVKIEFDKNLSFPLNSIVEVKIFNNNNLSNLFFKYYLEKEQW